MASSEKLLERMQNNPRDWRIEDLEAVARRHGVTWRQPGTSHVTFRAPSGDALSIPAARPIKSVYVKRFVEFIANVKGGSEQ